jgi:hypothetical protein
MRISRKESQTDDGSGAKKSFIQARRYIGVTLTDGWQGEINDISLKLDRCILQIQYPIYICAIYIYNTYINSRVTEGPWRSCGDLAVCVLFVVSHGRSGTNRYPARALRCFGVSLGLM